MLRYEIDYSDEYEDEDYDEDEDENEDENSTPQSDYELFCISIATCKNPEEIDALIEEKTEDKKAVEASLMRSITLYPGIEGMIWWFQWHSHLEMLLSENRL